MSGGLEFEGSGSKAGISKGALGGVVAGAVVFFALTVGLGVHLFRARSRRRKEDVGQEYEVDAGTYVEGGHVGVVNVPKQ